MSSALFYVDALPGAGELAVVDGDEGFHASNVRRIRVGEQIDLSDGAGALAHCVVEETAKGWLSARVAERLAIAAPRLTVTVVQALPKSDRSELAVELATEAGADGFLAWQASRCVARWDGPKVDKGLRRWEAVARSAARQSRRPYIPAVEGVVSTAVLIQRVGEAVAGGAVVLALHESAAESFAELPLAQADSLMLIVGPEGGIADEEIAALAAAGAKAVRLGPTVLRTSTAAAVALGAIGALTARWEI
ncbi:MULTISPECIES: 16S rRNA (uracil(1498)-N(3))-methyltransferase [unclassified Mycolicibacterium]|uniref:16S rRNA (uracil(1498)-N(3))-methyltransferase n=1 Tax=unclassified Mycolicibacterium TaxID=2636767 RepID=UPI0012DD856E|nr:MULTISPECIES: 16S rRNA (uracil(1498)-N(3))-methyltransferase [unclassified Mycolicibacterium]MUL83661.1 16S rRNA (uracil(1498)-N(3))-methyltransferase [Mycolicibacterium sp. CBMA 329]MUL90652.1 16S rRNA (uracil(1498)-N(3))-methyltransferase [Mycolicibacterium sp. CBMA 331]MUM00621.1 16S rRNA (uracil(1498)-N(3))-methyltransferase [Mycolicibacterium sp. CBMA 334]MUM28396.1 16S rRNA (uracil(1498)-N(3))-methyltransferase [Mycolicibacterium sp. CBMA 295]MUM41596.1 16S rRNA (uracil(1498)-N(3))-me